MTEPEQDRPAATAGEQDHTDPWVFAGEDADPPTNEGTPAVDEDHDDGLA